MEIPRINFNESNVGSRPILNNLRNRIGIVGQFSRGPANIFSFIDGFTEFANLYGSDTQPGSLGYQAAFDQGARDFGIVRVLSHRVDAKGEVILSGNPTKNNTLSLTVNGVQDVILAINTSFDMNVSIDGSNYTGNNNGYYVFKVLSAVTAAIKVGFYFVPITAASNRLAAIQWTEDNDVWSTILTDNDPGGTTPRQGLISPNGILTSFNAATSSNVDLQVEDGLNVKFGRIINTTPEPLFFKVGQVFTSKVESVTIDTPISAGETSLDVVNRFVSSIQGVDPLGLVEDNIQVVEDINAPYQSKVTFTLDGSIPGVGGTDGLRYTYSINLDEPDGIVRINNVSFDDAAPSELVTDDPDAAFIEVGDSLGVVLGNTTLTIPSATITVTSVTELNGVYTINLNTPLTGTTDSGPITIEFVAASAGFQVTGYQQTQGFIGGLAGPSNARRVFYTLSGQRLIEIVAVSPGAWGNSLRIDIRPIGASSFRVDVTDLQKDNFNPPITNESFVIDLTKQNAVDGNGVITALNTSNLIRGLFLPKVDNPAGFSATLLTLKPERLAPINSVLAATDTNNKYHPSFFGPNKLNQISLEGGSDGPNVTEEDYLQAISELAERNVNYLIMPGIHTNFKNAQAKLVSVAENSTEVDGLKIAILSARPGLKPGAASGEFQHINSPRAIAVAGWGTYSGQPGAPDLKLSPDSVLAGKLATIGFTVSPAARSTAGPVRNVIDVDTRAYTSRNSLQLYTDGRMEVLFPELNLGGLFFLNGRTTSSDPAWDRVVIRRTYDVIRQDLFNGLQSYKSEPHTQLLRRQIESSVNSYFSSLARNNKIANFGGCVCNDSNNPPENYINGQLNISISFLPLYSADYINITITRNTDSGLEIGVN